jgi:hypothetical protein
MVSWYTLQGWDQAEKLEWGAQWAAEDKLVTFAPGTVGASIQRAAEKIGSPALVHGQALDQACEVCEGNEAGPQCKGADDGMGDVSEISDSEGEGEADPGSVAPPEKASDDHTISVPFKALSVSYSTTTTSSKSSSKARWKMKTAGMKTGHGRKWCEKCSAVHHYRTSCGECKGELDAKGTATPPLPPPSAAATSELRRKRAREGEKVTASRAPFAAATCLFWQSNRPRRPPDYSGFETAPPKPAPRVAKAKKFMFSSLPDELDARSLTPLLGASASADHKNGMCSLPEELGACPKSLPPAEIEVFFNRAQKMLLKEVCALRCPTALQLT